MALTAQNTTAVTAVHELPSSFVRAQLEAVFDDIGVDAAKTGMLFSRPAIETVADFLETHPVPLVVDPVMVASSGAKLLRDDAVETLVRRLFPLATVVTPNLPEAEALAGTPGASRRELAERIHALGAPGRGHGRPRRRGGGAPVRRRDAPRDGRLPPRRARDAWRCTHSATLAALLARRVPLSGCTWKPRESPKQSGTDSSRSAAAKGRSTSCD